MESPTTPMRSAKRVTAQEGEEPKSKTVTVSDLAFTQLEKNAKKFKMQKMQYVSAAIAFLQKVG